MMDHLGSRERAAAADGGVYDRLLSLLDRRGIKATFAFVGAHAMSEDEARAKISLFTEGSPAARRWLAPFHDDLRARRAEGWFSPDAAAAIAASGLHELGSHGFTHLPLVEGEITLDDFEREMKGPRATAAFTAEKTLTLVYPRNQIGFAGELSRHGFAGYRESIAFRKSRRSSRWQHLFSDANPFPSSEDHPPATNGVARIPAGRMLNWRSGSRGAIPISWTARLWRKTIEDAVRSGGVAHLWSHPHNFVSGRDMFELFDEILKAAAPRVRSGELWNPTMREYALASLSR